VVLEGEALATEFGHKDVSFKLHRDDILCLYGLVGAGRTELARALVGSGRITSGRVVVRGQAVRIASMTEALDRYRIGFISEDRKQVGLILTHSIQRNLGITVWRRLASFMGFLCDAVERIAVQPFATKLNVRAGSLHQSVAMLGGGNQQKVSIAKWLAASVEILIIDEPTVGIDVNTKAQIHNLIVEIANSGLSALLISSDMAEMVALADRILIMHDFRQIGEVSNDHQYRRVSDAIMATIHQTEALSAQSPSTLELAIPPLPEGQRP